MKEILGYLFVSVVSSLAMFVLIKLYGLFLIKKHRNKIKKQNDKYEIDGTYFIDRKLTICVEGNYEMCGSCIFKGKYICDSIVCNSADRNDGKNVYFKEIK